jgi:hypothetical protein
MINIGVITMAIGDYEHRDRLAAGRRAVAEETSVGGIVLGIVIVAAIIGAIFFLFYDRTPSGSTATSERPTVTAPQTQPKTTEPRTKTITPTTPNPSTK